MMEFTLEDGESVVKSLTRKVMSALERLRISPNNVENARIQKNVKAFTDDITLADEESFAEVYDSLPYSYGREMNDCEIEFDQPYNKAKRAVELKINPQQDNIFSEEIIKHSPVFSNNSVNSVHTGLNESLNKSHYELIMLNGSSDVLNVSTSYSFCHLDKSRANLQENETGLGLTESLRKVYLNSNSSQDSQLSLKSHFVRYMTYSHPEIFRTGSDSDSLQSIYSPNMSTCSAESDPGSVKIRYDTSSESSASSQYTSLFSSLPKSPYLTSFEEISCFDELNDTESSNCSRVSAFRDEVSSSDLNETESPYTTSSLNEEFKHDIDFLAKSSFRTSTPDLETRRSSESSKAQAAESSKEYSNKSREDGNYSRSSFMSVSDSFTLLLRKHFVHGLSPLCKASSCARGGISDSRVRVRRSLLFVSPRKNIAVIPSFEGVKSPDTSLTIGDHFQPMFTNSSLTSDGAKFPISRYSRNTVLPKIMFQDETEEAVYYLVTKYLENSQCQW